MTSAVYRDLMRFRPDTLTPNAWAVQAGVSRTVWSDMRRHGNPSRRTLEKLLRTAGSSLAEFEALRIGEDRQPDVSSGERVGDFARRGWSAAQMPALPLIASRIAGEWGDSGSGIDLTEVQPDVILDRVERPAGLAADSSAYALTVVGNGMWPRFRSGRRIAVSPKSPLSIGDDVLVRLQRAAEGESACALIAELMRRNRTNVELRQFNPDRRYSVEMDDVQALERIAGELI